MWLSSANPICLAILRRDQRGHVESSSPDRLVAASSSHGHRTRAKLVIEAVDMNFQGTRERTRGVNFHRYVDVNDRRRWRRLFRPENRIGASIARADNTGNFIYGSRLLLSCDLTGSTALRAHDIR